MAKKLLTGADFNNQRLINLADGSSATDAVTRQQLDAAVRGLDWKASVRAASTTNLTLSAAQTVDGVALAVGDRVLVKDQTTATANGIYVVAAGAWARSADADADAEVTSGMAVTVESGTVNADKVYILATDGVVTLGTTALTFTLLGGSSAAYTAGNGLALNGTAFSVVAKPSGGVIVDATGVSIDTAVVTRKAAATIGDGTSTVYTVTHNLGTQDVDIILHALPSREVVEADAVATSATTATITFATAPAAGSYRVIIFG